MEKTVKTATGSVRASESSKPTSCGLDLPSSRIIKSCFAFGGVDVSCFFKSVFFKLNLFFKLIFFIYIFRLF